MASRFVSIGRTESEISALVEREAPALLDYFARRVGNPDDAADLLSETLMVTWRRKRAIPRDDTGARMWMYGVARKVLSGHRRSAVRRNSLADRLRLEIASHPTTTAKPDDLHDHVRGLIADLNEIDREIIALVYWEGFSLAEVATIMAMRPSTVRSRHLRARAELRDALRETGDAV